MEITFVSGDDWEGYYINGELITEGHRLEASWVVAELAKRGLIGGDEPVAVTERSANCTWLEDEGNLPDNLNDVVFDA